RELPEHASSLELYRAALALRAHDPVLSRPSALDVSVSDALLVAYRRNEAGERLLLLNVDGERKAAKGLAARESEAELLLASEPREHSDGPFELAAKSARILALRGRQSS
ncbi:MAG TPA: DUF3459 domain-containing protein, partial [Polyangiaceae bacterium]